MNNRIKFEMDIGCGEKAVVFKRHDGKYEINIKRPYRMDSACLMPTWETLDNFISFIHAVKFLKENALNICQVKTHNNNKTQRKGDKK